MKHIRVSQGDILDKVEAQVVPQVTGGRASTFQSIMLKVKIQNEVWRAMSLILSIPPFWNKGWAIIGEEIS